MKNECVEVVQRELELYGLKAEVVHRGKHLELAWECNGVSASVIVAVTPSDHRAPLNARGEARRALRRQNAQPLPTRVVSIQKAFQLPRPEDSGASRLAALENDFLALLDMFMESQAEANSLREQVASLQQRLGLLRITFDPPYIAPVVEEPVQEREQEEQVVATQVETAVVTDPMRVGRPWERLSRALADGRWRSRQELAELTVLKVTQVSTALDYQRKQGTVENGQHGHWRKKPEIAQAAVG